MTNRTARPRKRLSRRRVLVLSEYSEQIASARARIYSYVPRLRAKGWTVTVLSIQRGFSSHESAGVRLRRLMSILLTIGLAPFFDIVLVHRLFPRPAWLTVALRRAARRLVLDYDESYHVDHRGQDVSADRRERLDAMIAAADCTIVSNAYLEEYSRSLSSNVVVIPTALDVARYPRKVHQPRSPVVIGWIGSGGAQEYLESLTNVFTRLYEVFGERVRLQVVTSPIYRVSLATSLPLRSIDWQLAKEHEYFEQFDIGIMPLPANRRSLGKASYKALQYMAAAVPPVASPVGMNTTVIEPESTGFLPRSDDEWFEVLSRLVRDPALRQDIGDRGRAFVQREFSIDRWFRPFRDAVIGEGVERASNAAAVISERN